MVGSRFRLVATVAALVVTAACTSGPGPGNDTAYIAEIEQHRAAVEQRFRDDPDTPIPAEKKDSLLPLKYYPIEPSMSTPASLQLNNERPVFEMPTSTGTLRRMQLVGTLNFTLQGQPLSLGAFVEEGTRRIDSLFVPFADLTTGTETYPAGRYLDLNPTATGYYTIDFNKAYNPYCAYNSTYECPYPPPSNRLKIAIRAGEKAPGA